MYRLQFFDVDTRGRRTGVVHMGGPYESAPKALADAARLRLGTHFRIAIEGGHIILEDSLPAMGDVIAA